MLGFFTHLADFLYGAVVFSCLFLAIRFVDYSFDTDNLPTLHREKKLRSIAAMLMCVLAASFCIDILSWVPDWIRPDIALKIELIVYVFVFPVLTLLVNELTRCKPANKKYAFLYFLPAALSLFLLFLPIKSFFIAYAVFVLITFVVTLVYSLRAVHRYSVYVKENYSDDYGRDLSWVRTCYLLMFIMFVLLAGFVFYDNVYYATFYNFVGLIVFPLFAYRLAAVIRFREGQPVDNGCYYPDETEDVALTTPAHDEPTTPATFSDTSAQDHAAEAETTSPAEPLTKDALFLKRLKEVCEDTKLYTTEDITREELARAMMLNHSYLTRMLKSATGKTFYEYINSLRMNYAQELLADPEFPLDAIPLEIGYKHRSTYYRVFSDYFHCTPSEYRSRLQTKPNEQ